MQHVHVQFMSYAMAHFTCKYTLVLYLFLFHLVLTAGLKMVFSDETRSWKGSTTYMYVVEMCIDSIFRLYLWKFDALEYRTRIDR